VTNYNMLSTRELAERWNLRPATLRVWRTEGRGPRYVKLGKSVRYPMSDVLDFEERGRVTREYVAASGTPVASSRQDPDT
jgi:predicted DNA-binding transcriptional regulator AlpA